MTQKPMSNSNSATNQTDTVVEQAKQKASDVVDQAKQTVSSVTDQAQEQVSTRLTSQKDQATQGLGAVSKALRQASENLNSDEQGTVKQYVDMAAGGVERVTDYLELKDIRTMVTDVENFARKQPGIFLAGAFLLGAVGARFLKSSSPSTSNYSPDYRGNYTPRNDYSQNYIGTGRGPSYTPPAPPVPYRPNTATTGKGYAQNSYRATQDNTVNSSRYNPVDYSWTRPDGENL